MGVHALVVHVQVRAGRAADKRVHVSGFSVLCLVGGAGEGVFGYGGRCVGEERAGRDAAVEECLCFGGVFCVLSSSLFGCFDQKGFQV